MPTEPGAKPIVNDTAVILTRLDFGGIVSQDLWERFQQKMEECPGKRAQARSGRIVLPCGILPCGNESQ